MEEEKLVKLLLVIGAISLGIIFISTKLLEESTFSFVSHFMPQIFCKKDYRGNFILGKETSSEVCNEIEDMEILINPKICKNFEGREKDACLNLVKIAERRKEDCSSIFPSKTSVTQAEVEKYCKVFNITRENITAISF